MNLNLILNRHMWLLATVLDNGAIGHMEENGGLEDQKDVCEGLVDE